MSVLARVRMVAPEDKRQEIVRTLRSLLEPTQVEPGCVTCHFYQDVQDENVLNYVEEWCSQEDLERHLRSDQYRKLLAVIDAAAEPPEIRFDTVSQTRGIETIEAARHTE